MCPLGQSQLHATLKSETKIITVRTYFRKQFICAQKKSPSSHRTQNTPPPSSASYFSALEEEYQAVATTTQEHPSTNIAPQSLQGWGTLPPQAPPQEGPTEEPLTMPNPPSHQKKISLQRQCKTQPPAPKKNQTSQPPPTHAASIPHQQTTSPLQNRPKPPLQGASTTHLAPLQPRGFHSRKPKLQTAQNNRRQGPQST